MARIFLDEMGGINQGGILASYGLPMSPFSTEEYAPTIVETPSRPTRTRRKQSKPKPKRNDGIIRNHDSVWDYKIQDGKLLTRRKTSDGKWYDITNNEEARQKIESFTGRSIGSKQNTVTNQGSKQATTPRSNTTTTPSNSSQSQPSILASTAQTQQITRPAATQPTRQQAARQDSTRRDTTAIPQSRSLATTRGSNTEPDWQNMTDAEVQAYFANSPLGGVTKTSKGNSNKKTQLLSDADLRANGWYWSDVAPGKTNDVTTALFYDANRRTKAGEKILLDSEDRIVPKSDVNRYINRGRIPLYISDYDAQFYQPQSENSTLKDVRKAQDIRRNREFDRQRNSALATMFSLPAFGISMASAPAATLLALGGSELVGAGFEGAYKHATGKSWEETLGGTDPNAQFYANMIQPGRLIGGMLGAGVANATAPARQAIGRAVSNGVNNIIGNGEMPSFLGLLQRQAYANRPIGLKLPSIQEQVNSGRQFIPKTSRNLSGTVNKGKSLANAKAATKAYWEERQPYKVKVKKDATGRLYPTFNTKKVNSKFKGYPSYDDIERINMNANTLETILSNFGDIGGYNNTIPIIQGLKSDINSLYGLPAGYWQSARPAPGYFDGPRYGSLFIGQ